MAIGLSVGPSYFGHFLLWEFVCLIVSQKVCLLNPAVEVRLLDCVVESLFVKFCCRKFVCSIVVCIERRFEALEAYFIKLLQGLLLIALKRQGRIQKFQKKGPKSKP